MEFGPSKPQHGRRAQSLLSYRPGSQGRKAHKVPTLQLGKQGTQGGGGASGSQADTRGDTLLSQALGEERDTGVHGGRFRTRSGPGQRVCGP